MQESVCLDCERPLPIPSDHDIGDVLICPQCSTDLEIVSLEPLIVDWPHDDTYDDWDGDIEDYDDEFDIDDNEWLDDDDDDYSWMLSKQKRHQELDELDRRRPVRPNVTRETLSRGQSPRNSGGRRTWSQNER